MKLLVCLFVLGCTSASFGKVLPDAIANFACRRSTPNLNECLLNSIQNVVPLVVAGVPEVNIPPLDPYVLESVTAEGDMEAVKVKMVMTNATFTGHGLTHFSKFKLDPATLNGEVTVKIPYINMTTEYSAIGQLFTLPLESRAFMSGNFTDIDASSTFHMKTVSRNGVKYFTVDKMTTKMFVGTGKIKITAVDPAQQPAVNLLQTFFNENDRLVMDAVNPILKESASEFYKHLSNKYLRMIPAEEILPH